MSDKIEKMTDDDFKKIMRQLGMPESHSLDGFYSDNDTHIAWRAWQAAQSYCPSPDPVKLAELGWQMIECPICGGGAQAFPQQPTTSITAAELERLQKDAAKVLHAEQIRIAAVAAVREVTGCPDIKGKDGAYLVDSLIVNLIEMQDDAAIAGETEHG